MVRTYVVNSSRVTTREYLFENSWLLLPVVWLLKLLRVRLASSTDDPAVETLEPFVVGEDQLPDDVRAQWADDLQFLRSQGFDLAVFHRIRVPAQSTTIFRATLAEPNGNVARLQRRVWTVNKQTKVRDTRQLETEFRDGRRLVSFAGTPDMLAPDNWDVARRKPCPVAELWDEHQTRLADDFGGVRVSVTDVGELHDFVERQHAELVRFHLDRGVFEPGPEIPSPGEEAASGQSDAVLEEAAALAELEKLGRQSISWSSVAWGLALSLAAFAAVFVAQWDMKLLWMLLPILFVHEGGHWLAMNMFGYRNMRMFFIPFLGAAVSGRNLNVSGWKKATVALMGPVPSIVAGIVVAVVGIRYGLDWLVELSLLALAVNVFNLLPILPLDGGQTLQATLFCRSRFLDLMFRGLAVAGLLGLSVALDVKALMYVAIVMAVSLPLAYKLAKITEELREAEDLPTRSPDGTTVPQPTALAIIARLRERFSTALPPKAVAQHTLSIFESLNARPPGALATLGLLGVYFGSAVVGLVAIGVVVLARQGELGPLFDMMARQPQTRLERESVRHTPPSDAPPAGRTLGVQATDAGQAGAVFGDLSGRFPKADVVQFGSTVFLTLRADEAGRFDALFSEFDRRGWRTLAVGDRETISVEMQAIAPDAPAAGRIERDLSAYAACPAWLRPLPPWSEGWAGSAEQGRWRKNRQTLQAVLQVDISDRLPAQAEHWKEIAEATRRRDLARAAELQAEMHQARRAALEDAVAELAASRDDPESRRIMEAALPSLLAMHAPFDVEQLDEEDLQMLANPRRITEQQRPLYELRELFGTGPAPNGNADEDADGNADAETVPLTWPSVWVQREGLLLELSVSVPRPGVELADFAGWLYERGCSDLKYEIWGLTTNPDDAVVE